MSNIVVGQKAPNFCLKDADEKEICLKDFKGRWIVLYFYPKDNTPGCTREALDFTEKLEEFEKLGAVIIGVSKDSTRSHKRFIEKYGIRVILLSDPEHKVIEVYGAWDKKKKYGREYYGTVRSTFLIDPEGIVRKVWRNVKVKGHVEDVLNTLKDLKSMEK